MKKVSQTCNRYGLKMNIKKTKFMIITKDQSNKLQDKKLVINNTVVERVHSYKYLGTWINSNGDTSKEIKCRVEIARSAFIKMRKIFSNRDLPLELRARMLRCYVFSTLMYGMEAWTMKKADVMKIQAFEMWCYRRILNIPWVDKVTNQEVLRRMDKEQEVMNSIKARKLQFFGHMLRGDKYELLHLILQGKICGKKGRGRPRMSWLQNLKEWFGYNTKLFNAARNRHHIAMMVSNLR